MGLLIESNKLFPHEPQRERRLTLFKGLKESFPEGTATHKECGPFAITQAQKEDSLWVGRSLRSGASIGDLSKGKRGLGRPDLVTYLGDTNWRIRSSRSVPATRDLVSNKMKEKGGEGASVWRTQVTIRGGLSFMALRHSGVICPFHKLVSGHWGRWLQGSTVGSNRAKMECSVFGLPCGMW